jgi:hypothetical protein
MTIKKGIVYWHFWKVMLYLNMAKFHISIILIRLYKNEILIKLDEFLEKSPVLTAVLGFGHVQLLFLIGQFWTVLDMSKIV